MSIRSSTLHFELRPLLLSALLLVSYGCSDDDDDANSDTTSGGTGGGGSSANAGKGGAGKGGTGGSAGKGGASGAGKGGAGGAGKGGAGAAGRAGGGDEGDGGVSSDERAQDSRTFSIDESTLAFDADPSIESDRWTGVIDGAGYRVEVPKDWNGNLVMYAHGYAGTGEALRVTTPSIRHYLLEKGYAWAASSYSKNYYDVRVGVEDTNKLALAFTRIAEDNGRKLDAPKKRYLIGHSMGGHITGAAIEKEAQETAENKVHYDAALPMCGVLGDTQLFNYFAAYQFAAQKLADTKIVTGPSDEAMSIFATTQAALFSEYPSKTTAAGDTVKNIVRNLTGGARPGFDQGFATKQWQDAVWSTFGGDGTISGILASSVLDTRELVYQLDDDAAESDAEKTFNDEVYRATPVADANGLRSDGLRWIPQVNGEIDIPVLALHTLGDLYVPFKMEQVYHQRVNDKGNGERLVQRAYRGVGHCEFTYNEQADAFAALVDWEENGKKPEGDDVTDPAKLASDDYGCAFTDNDFTDAEKTAGTLPTTRALIPACP